MVDEMGVRGLFIARGLDVWQGPGRVVQK